MECTYTAIGSFLRDLFTLPPHVNHVNTAHTFIISAVDFYNVYLIITFLTFFYRELERRELTQYSSFVKNLRNPLRV